ncbi:hypothetical protein DFR37_1221, partial [Eoetvoesiella caeni]
MNLVSSPQKCTATGCALSEVADQRFLVLLWKFIKAGCVDRDLFRASSEGVP